MALAAGSIAFTGYNNATSLSFNFAALEDIPAGTVIKFTNNNWNGSAFDGQESTWTWTAGSDITAGTIVTLEDLETLPGQGVANPTSNLGSITYSGAATPFFLADALYAFTGDEASPDFVSAFSIWPYTDYNTLEGTGLIDGLTAVNLLRDGSPSFGPSLEIGDYTGPTSGFASFDDYLAAINDLNNWNYQDEEGVTYGGGAPEVPLDTNAFVTDPDVQTVSFDPNSMSMTVSEGDSGQTIVTFTIVRSGSTIGDLDFSGSLVFGEGVDADDFGGVLPGDFSGTIPDGQNSVTIQIALSGDIKFESDETIKLVLDQVSNPSSDTNIGGTDSATVVVENDDAPQTVGFASGSQSFIITEGDDGLQYITFTVERSGSTTGNMNFVVELQSDQVNADDFGGKLPTVIAGLMLDGQSSGTVTIKLTGDQRFENDETFRLVIVSAENEEVGAVISDQNATSYVTITDDDDAPAEIGGTDVVEGQIIVSGNDHFTIAAGGMLDVSSSSAILWEGDSTTVVIDNAGTIKSADRAFELGDVTGQLTLNNEIGGRIFGVMDIGGVATTASVTINNSGLINVGASGYFNLSTSGGVVTLNNLATGYITRDNAGGDVIKDASKAVINNWGKIVSPSDIASGYEDPEEYGGDAVDIGSGAGNLIHNYDGGLIEGSRHGITGKRGVTIINDEGGVISGRNGSGVNFDNNTDISRMVTVTNHGTILGEGRGYSDSDGDAIDCDGLVKVDNYGMIAGLGAHGYHNGGLNHSEALAIGGGEINNYAGGVIYSIERAIQIDDSEEGGAPAAVTITNAGLIHGAGGQAINIIGEQEDSLVNSGTIIGSVEMGGGNDTVELQAGSLINGIVSLGAGNDTLTSETGNLVVEGGSGNDTIYGGTGTDTVIFSGDAGDYTWVTNDDGTITITDNRDIDGNDGVDVISGVEVLRFEDGDVELTDDNYNTAPADIALSNDDINEDVEEGSVIGLLTATDADGDELAFSLTDSADGTFSIVEADGEVRLVLSKILDFETTDSYDITISVSDGGSETLRTLTIAVNDVADLMEGTSKANTLNGEDTADLLKGLGGKDKLNGNGGDDLLWGGGDADKLTGGEGSDTFFFIKGHSGRTRSTADLITDFSIDDGDLIDLSGFDADTKTDDDQEFQLIAGSKFHRNAGELIAIAEKGGTSIYGDVDGNGKADFMIRLDDKITLDADSFVL